MGWMAGVVVVVDVVAAAVVVAGVVIVRTLDTLGVRTIHLRSTSSSSSYA